MERAAPPPLLLQRRARGRQVLGRLRAQLRRHRAAPRCRRQHSRQRAPLRRHDHPQHHFRLRLFAPRCRTQGRDQGEKQRTALAIDIRLYRGARPMDLPR